MLRKSFFAVLVLTLGMACVARAVEDDINTYGLWHGETIIGTVSPDDTSIMGVDRTPIPLNISGGAAYITTSSGYIGNALDYGTNGRQYATTSTTWPSAPAVDTPGSEFKLDGWFYVPNAAALPIPTSAGGSGAATVYIFQISSSSAGGTKCYLCLNPGTSSGTNVGYAFMRWQKTNYSSPQNLDLRFYQYNLATGAAFPPGDPNYRDLTGRWLHIQTYARYTEPEPAWDPNYNSHGLIVTDSSTGTTYELRGDTSGTMTGSGTSVWIGGISGKMGCTPYRGYRGLIDELKISNRAHDPMVAYGPTPANTITISPTSDLQVSWHKAAPFNPADTITQDVWKGLVEAFDPNDPNWTKVATGITTSTASLGAVAMGNTYYWKVDSIDSGTGVTTASQIWHVIVDDVPPTVDIGANQVTWLVSGTRTVSLTPTVTDPDTAPGSLTYSWTQLAGPTATIVSPSSKDTNVIMTQTGPYWFQLAVSDASSTVNDVVKVEVFNTACAASKAVPGYVAQTTDYNDDCSVTFRDFAGMAGNWAECNSLDPACL